MLKKFLKGHMNFIESASSWEESIMIASKPLLVENYITKRYVESMTENVKINGSYIVIIPRFALPHSRPDEGVNKTGISLLKLKKPVTFPESKEVELIIVLAANDTDTHLVLISELTEIIIDDEKMDLLFNCTNEKEILEIL